MSETFVAAEGIETHMELGQYEMAEWFAKIAPYSEKYAVHMDVGSVSNFTSLAEIGTFPGIYQKGDPCIHMVWAVPAELEDEMDVRSRHARFLFYSLFKFSLFILLLALKSRGRTDGWRGASPWRHGQ